jgi:hypothetical protein
VRAAVTHQERLHEHRLHEQRSPALTLAVLPLTLKSQSWP